MSKFDVIDFENFTYTRYYQLLKIALRKYSFCSFKDFIEGEKFILWRHDMDLSVYSGLQLAKIENELGVKSTYFVHLHNNFYHFWEKENVNIIKEIIDLGHHLGLHFDANFYGNMKNIEILLANEKRILEQAFNVPVEVFSFHNPDSMILKLDDYKYADMINTYSKFFRDKVDYISDSNGYWRYKKLEDVLLSSDSKPLQVLTHPGWWSEKPMSPRDKITYHIEQRAKKQHEFYDAVLLKMGRKNVR